MFANGHSAVALFLVVSGFIFAYGSFGREITYSSFMKNRLLRIYPLFLTLLAFSIYTRSAPVDLSGIIGTILPFGINHERPHACGDSLDPVCSYVLGTYYRVPILPRFSNFVRGRE
ncbi:MAG: acyltransferase family protein [Syntrophobacteraceae bacterium]